MKQKVRRKPDFFYGLSGLIRRHPFDDNVEQVIKMRLQFIIFILKIKHFPRHISGGVFLR